VAKRIIWSDAARSDIRAIDQRTALRLLRGVARFALGESGDVKQLEGYQPAVSAAQFALPKSASRCVD